MHIVKTRPGFGTIRGLPRAVARRWPALAVATVAVALPTGVALANPPQDFPDGIVTSFLHVTDGPGQGSAQFDLGLIANGLFAVQANGTSVGVSAGGGHTGVLGVATNADGIGVDARGATAVRAQGDTAVDAEGGIGGTAIKAASSSTTPAVVVSNTSGDGIDATGTNGAGISGTASGQDSGIGVLGTGKGQFGIGVAGNGDDVGVAGSGINVGVRAHAVNGTGLTADSPGGLGGDFSGKEAPIRLDPASTAGAPTTGTHHKGELYVDSKGQLFLCVADSVNGNPGSWKHVHLD